ncbi:surfeit locus 1 cytochrome c oxidase biogenesis protein [Wolffia australiana]
MIPSFSKALRARRLVLYIPQYFTAIQASNARAISSQEVVSETPASINAGKEGGSWSKFLLFIPGAVTFGLGSWQIVRRQEKIETIEHRQKRLEMEPIKGANESTLVEDFNSLEFRRLECKGIFDESKSIFVGPRSRSISGLTENGYFLITPLIPRGSESNCLQMPILVNRGWVPREWRDKALNHPQGISKTSFFPAAEDSTKSEGRWWKFWDKKTEPAQDQKQEENICNILGVIRGSENPSIFVPANNPESGQWFYIDVPAMARSSGLPENIIYVEDINEKIDPKNPYPVPRDSNSLIRHSVMPQDHLNYSFTWYALSAAVTYMAVKRIRGKKSKR